MSFYNRPARPHTIFRVGPARPRTMFRIWETELRVRVPYLGWDLRVCVLCLRPTCASAYHI